METPDSGTGEERLGKVYRDIMAGDLTTFLLSNPSSFNALHEEHLIPVYDNAGHGYDPSTNYFEIQPIHHDDGGINSGVRGATGNEVVQNQYPDTSSNEKQSTGVNQDDIPDHIKHAASEQMVQTNLAITITATPSNVKVARRSPTRTTGGPFTCSHCGVQHPKYKAHRSHMVSHETAQLKCPTCGKAVKRKGDFVRHMKLHEEDYICNGTKDACCGMDGCGMVFDRMYPMVRHWDSVKRAQKKRA